MSYAEFPHTNYSDTDAMELIILYKELISKYDGTLETIESVSRRLDEYQKNTNTVIEQKVQQALSQAAESIQRVNLTLDRELAAAMEQTNTQYNNLRDLINRNSAEIVELNQSVSEAIEDLTAALQILESALKGEIELSKAAAIAESVEYTAKQIAALEDRLLYRINQIDKSTGHVAIKWLWQYGCYHGGFAAIDWYYLTCITAKEFDKSNITARQWYVDGRRFFRKHDHRDYMYSPVTGRWCSVKEAVLELASALKINGLTAEEYESLGFTAEEYDKMKINAQKYDWAGRELLCTENKQNF